MPLASEYLDRQELAPTGWSSAEWACVDAQVRERAFFMAGVQQAHILQEFRRMAAGVAAGEISPSEARIALREYLKATGYKPEEGKEGTLQDLSSRRRIELVLDTNVRQARGWAQHVQYQRDPNVGGQELFRRFRRSVPRNWELRWAEAAEAVGWEGVARGVPFVATLDSPIWRRLSRFDLPYPPFDFNSGMATRPVSVERCRELGLTPSETPPLPSLNEETSAGVAGMDADLVRSLESVMGGLVQRVGDRLQMADVNGTRPYTAPQLAAVWAAPLPKGVPNLQAEAMAAWRQDPKALLPGGNKRHLLPALRMLAARLRPEAPEELREWLREHGANDEVRNTAGGGVVENSKRECQAKNGAKCRYHHPKGTTREGKTKKRKKANKKEDSRKYEGLNPPTVTIANPIISKEGMTSELFSQRDKMSEKDGKQRVPIRGAGSIAPGMDLRVFITRKTIEEIRSKIGDSADAMSHFTAAAHVSALWEQSVHLRDEDDRYNSKGDSTLKKVHKRLAKMRIGDDAYLVKITVKSFKNKNSLPIFYTVKTIKISQ